LNDFRARMFFEVDFRDSFKMSTSSNGPKGSSSNERMVTLVDITLVAEGVRLLSFT
jgi:hypothetical protein